jgi:hypothetical protein
MMEAVVEGVEQTQQVSQHQTEVLVAVEAVVDHKQSVCSLSRQEMLFKSCKWAREALVEKVELQARWDNQVKMERVQLCGSDRLQLSVEVEVMEDRRVVLLVHRVLEQVRRNRFRLRLRRIL